MQPIRPATVPMLCAKVGRRDVASERRPALLSVAVQAGRRDGRFSRGWRKAREFSAQENSRPKWALILRHGRRKRVFASAD